MKKINLKKIFKTHGKIDEENGVKELKKWFEIVGSSNQDYINRANQFLQKKPL